MVPDLPDVAKLRVVVVRNGERWCLMSRKRSSWPPIDDKLEFIGGHLKEGQTPTEGLLDELSEEEATGLLAARARDLAPSPTRHEVDGDPHHLFELTLEETEARALEAAPEESRGFEMVLEADLLSGALYQDLTPRTREILGLWQPRDPEGPRSA